jgi:hypothetical protein
MTGARESPEGLLLIAFRPLNGKQKNKTSPLRAPRFCGEYELPTLPPLMGFIKSPLLRVVIDRSE